MDYGFKTTTHGRAVLATCMAKKRPPEICRVAFGKGKIAEGVNLCDQHTLLEYVSDGTLGDLEQRDDRLFFTIQYANSAHPEVETFYIREFMVFIRDPETGAETDFLYGTLGDYPLPVPKYHASLAPSVFNLPLVLVLSDELKVQLTESLGLVTFEELWNVVARAVAEHNADMRAHASKVYVAATRPRDPNKPSYGLSGKPGEQRVALEAEAYTGGTEIGVVVSGVLYDARNVSTNGGSAPDGTIIITEE